MPGHHAGGHRAGPETVGDPGAALLRAGGVPLPRLHAAWMLDGPPPLLSVPFSELSRHVLSGSIVSVDEVLETPVSAELRAALGLLRAHCGDGAALRIVVRPEMFTHGASLAWLRAQVGAAQAHLCLSDGESVRVVPGLANHVFFYRLGQAGSVEGILRLRRRAPELLAGLASQVNTSLALVHGRGRRPRTTVLPTAEGDAAEGLVVPFFVPHGTMERDARSLAGHDPVALPASSDLTYAAACGAALDSVAFVAGLANRIVEACTHPDRLLVIGAPPADRPEDALAALFSALRRSGFALPSGIPPNVFLHVHGGAALPGAAFGGRSRLVVHEADTLWRLGAAFCAPFATATVLRERRSAQHGTGFHPLLRALTGRAWQDGLLADETQASLVRYVW